MSKIEELRDQEKKLREELTKVGAELRTLREDPEFKKQSLAKIDQIVQKCYEMLQEAQQIAMDANVMFTFSPAYGMGGRFEPNEGWVASSQEC